MAALKLYKYLKLIIIMKNNNMNLKKYNKLVLTSYFKNLKFNYFNINLFLYSLLYSISTGFIWTRLIYGSEIEINFYLILVLIQFFFIGPLFFILLNKFIYINKNLFNNNSFKIILTSALFPGIFSPLFIILFLNFKINNYLKKNNLMLIINENSFPENLELDTYKYNNSLDLNDYLNNKYILTQEDLINQNKKYRADYLKYMSIGFFIVIIFMVFLLLYM